MLAERQANFRCLVLGADAHIVEPCALITAAHALHPVLSGRKILNFEATLLLADDHEGETSLVVLKFDETPGPGRPGRFAPPPLKGPFAVCPLRRPSRKQC